MSSTLRASSPIAGRLTLCVSMLTGQDASLVPRPVCAIRVTRGGGLEPSAIARGRPRRIRTIAR